MATTDPVPSKDPNDLLFNAQKLDEVVNGTAPTYTTRLGVVRKTVFSYLADMAAQLGLVEAARATAVNTTIPAKVASVDAAVAATFVGQAAASQAASSASATAAAASQAAAAGSAASIGAFATTAAGMIAAPTNGQFFHVVDTIGFTKTLYKNVSGVATPQGEAQSLRSALTQKDSASLGRGLMVPVSNSSGLVTIVNDICTGQINCDIIFRESLQRLGLTAGQTVSLAVRFDSGTPSAVLFQTRNGGGTTLDNITAVRNGNFYVAENITTNVGTTEIQCRVQNTGGAGVIQFRRPLVSTNGLVGIFSLSPLASLPDAFAARDASALSNLFADPAPIPVVGTVTQAGSNYIFPAASAAEMGVTYATAGITLGQQITFAVQLTAPPGRDITIRESTTTGGASLGTFERSMTRLGYTNWWFGTITAGDFSGSAVQARIRIDNRDGVVTTGTAAQIVAGSASCVLGTVPLQRSVPSAVRELIKTEGYFDPSAGSDTTGLGTRAAPFASFQKALASGASIVYQRVSATPHRPSAGLSLARNVILRAYAEAGDTADYAKVWFSPGVTISALPVSADPNVRYYATATNPVAIWENNASTITRLGVVQADPGGVRAAFSQASASEAAVGAAANTAGAWWYGAGSLGTGVYFRPVGDTVGTKLLELGAADIGLTVAGFDLDISGMELFFGRSNVLNVTRSRVRSNNVRYGHSGGDDAVTCQSAVNWTGVGVEEFVDAGDDGFGTNGNITATHQTVYTHHNIGDGYAPHNTGNKVSIAVLRAKSNGKQGFVTIAPGDYSFGIVEATGNADVDFLIKVNSATPTTVNVMGSITADEIQIDCNGGTASTITGKLVNVRGSVFCNANIAIEGHRCYGKASYGLRVDGGVVTVDDFSYKNNVTVGPNNGRGIDLRGGTLTAKTGELLRCTVGISQTGGTLSLDASYPVNVYGNTTQFAGLSAPDQAKTLAVAAV